MRWWLVQWSIKLSLLARVGNFGAVVFSLQLGCKRTYDLQILQKMFKDFTSIRIFMDFFKILAPPQPEVYRRLKNHVWRRKDFVRLLCKLSKFRVCFCWKIFSDKMISSKFYVFGIFLVITWCTMHEQRPPINEMHLIIIIVSVILLLSQVNVFECNDSQFRITPGRR